MKRNDDHPHQPHHIGRLSRYKAGEKLDHTHDVIMMYRAMTIFSTGFGARPITNHDSDGPALHCNMLLCTTFYFVSDDDGIFRQTLGLRGMSKARELRHTKQVPPSLACPDRCILALNRGSGYRPDHTRETLYGTNSSCSKTLLMHAIRFKHAPTRLCIFTSHSAYEDQVQRPWSGSWDFQSLIGYCSNHGG